VNARVLAIVEVFRTALVAADRLAPAERDAVSGALMTDLRSRRPEAVSPLRLEPPPARIRGPRGPRGGQ
jgi:hypothetical protein